MTSCHSPASSWTRCLVRSGLGASGGSGWSIVVRELAYLGWCPSGTGFLVTTGVVVAAGSGRDEDKSTTVSWEEGPTRASLGTLRLMSPRRVSSIIVLESGTIVIDEDITYRFYPSEGNDPTPDIGVGRGWLEPIKV